MQLFEQYRPNEWAQVVGQQKVVELITRLRTNRGLGGRAYWLAGQSGTGKSTIARLLAAEVAEPWSVEELDSQWLTAARLADVERQISGRPLGGKGWAMIVNEAHGLSAPAVRALLVALERVPAHAVWIFTTTIEGQEALFDGCDDSSPLLSRCVELPLARRDLAKAFAERAQLIAQTEGLAGDKSADWFVKLAQKRRNNLRAMLCDLEAGAALA
jgi:replication-associated recombination protein RarA